MLILGGRISLLSVFNASREVASPAIYQTFRAGGIAATNRSEIEETVDLAAFHVCWNCLEDAEKTLLMLPSSQLIELEWFACMRPLYGGASNGFINIKTGSSDSASPPQLYGLPVFLEFSDTNLHSYYNLLDWIEADDFLAYAIAEADRRFSNRPERLAALLDFDGELGVILPDTPDVAEEDFLQGLFADGVQVPVMSRREQTSLEKHVAAEIVKAYDEGRQFTKISAKQKFGAGMGQNSFTRAWARAREKRPELMRPGRRSTKTDR